MAKESLPMMGTLMKNGDVEIDEEFLEGRRPCVLLFGEFMVTITKEGALLQISPRGTELLVESYKGKGSALIVNYKDPKRTNEIEEELLRVNKAFFPPGPVIL